MILYFSILQIFSYVLKHIFHPRFCNLLTVSYFAENYFSDIPPHSAPDSLKTRLKRPTEASSKKEQYFTTILPYISPKKRTFDQNVPKRTVFTRF